jgi:hypothetical protein
LILDHPPGLQPFFAAQPAAPPPTAPPVCVWGSGTGFHCSVCVCVCVCVQKIKCTRRQYSVLVLPYTTACVRAYVHGHGNTLRHNMIGTLCGALPLPTALCSACTRRDVLHVSTATAAGQPDRMCRPGPGVRQKTWRGGRTDSRRSTGLSRAVMARFVRHVQTNKLQLCTSTTYCIVCIESRFQTVFF